MKNTIKYFFAAAALGVVTAHAGDSNCDSVASNVNSRVSADKSEVLNVVSDQAGKNPNCVCEIVKTAIIASKANKQTVGQIVAAAGNASPDSLDLIVQCATAAAPDASAEIQAAAATVQGATGPTGGPFNPLDVPGDAGAVPNPGGDSEGTGTEVPVVNPEPEPVTSPNPA